MNTNAASLDRLHDILGPAPVSWWPPASGWYWVMAFALIFLVAFALKSFIRWQHNRYRREALPELARLETALKIQDQRAATMLALSELLKRVALTAFPREQVATLTGKPWFEFLDHTGSNAAFSNGLGATLENAIYDPRTVAALDEQKIQELTQAVRHWIKNHQTGLESKDAKTTKYPSTGRPLLPSLPALEKPSV